MRIIVKPGNFENSLDFQKYYRAWNSKNRIDCWSSLRTCTRSSDKEGFWLKEPYFRAISGSYLGLYRSPLPLHPLWINGDVSFRCIKENR